MPEESIEELRFKIIKNILAEFPELKERLREYLQEENEKEKEQVRQTSSVLPYIHFCLNPEA